MIQAEQEFTLALEADQSFILAWLGRSETRVTDKRFAESRDDCTQTIRLRDHFAPGYGCRAVGFFLEGYYDNTETEQREAQDHFSKALDDARRAIKADPYYAPAYVYEGASLCRLGDTEAGIKQIRHAMEISQEPPFISMANYWLTNFCEHYHPPVE